MVYPNDSLDYHYLVQLFEILFYELKYLYNQKLPKKNILCIYNQHHNYQNNLLELVKLLNNLNYWW